MDFNVCDVIASASKASAGQTAAAMEKMLAPEVVKGKTMSEVAALLKDKMGTTAKALEECGPECVSLVEESLLHLAKSGRNVEESLNTFETLANRFIGKAGKIGGEIAASRNATLTCASDLLSGLNLNTLGAKAFRYCNDLDFQSELAKLFKNSHNKKNLQTDLYAVEKQLAMLDDYKELFSRELIEIVKSGELRDISGYDTLIRQLAAKGQQYIQGFAVRQTLLKVKELQPRFPDKIIKLEIPKDGFPKGVDIDLAIYAGEVMEKAYALKSVESTKGFSRNFSDGIKQLRESGASEKIISIEMRSGTVEDLIAEGRYKTIVDTMKELEASGFKLEIVDYTGKKTLLP